MDKAKLSIFDLPHVKKLVEAKMEFLEKLLPNLIDNENIKTALDVGCGVGYFSKYLKDLGLNVTSLDGRSENIKEAKSRYSDIAFRVCNIEDASVRKLGSFDIVLCLGVLYHLENPFLGIRNISSLTQKICIIESVVAPFKLPFIVLYEEGCGEDQGLNYLSLIPTEHCLIKLLLKSGFSYIYKINTLPVFGDFYPSLLVKKKRLVIIASKEKLDFPFLKSAKIFITSNRFMWHRLGIRFFLNNRIIRGLLKKIKKFKK